jgi:hypothetical protein
MKDSEIKKKLLELIEQGAPIAKACKKVGIHRSTFYEWRKGDDFGMAVAQARLLCIDETSGAAEYWMHVWVRQGDKKSVYKWIDTHNAVQMTIRNDGPMPDEDGVPLGFTREELFALMRASEVSGLYRFTFENFSKKLMREYRDWKDAHSSDLPSESR